MRCGGQGGEWLFLGRLSLTRGRDSAKGGVMNSVIRIFLVISLMPLGWLMAEDLKVKSE